MLNTNIEYCVRETEVIKKLISILRKKKHVGIFPIDNEDHNELFCCGRDFIIDNSEQKTEVNFWYPNNRDWKIAYDNYDCLVLFEVIEKSEEEHAYNSFDKYGKKVNVDISLRTDDSSIYGYSPGKDIVVITLFVGTEEYKMSRFVCVMPFVMDDSDFTTEINGQLVLIQDDDIIAENLKHKIFYS